MKKIFAIVSLLLISLAGIAQDKQPVYKSSFLDFIAEKGGGTLEFSVGRYLTGSVQLRDGVDIYLREGAVIVGSTNIYAYKGAKGIFWGEGVKDVTIEGKGVIDGRGPGLLDNIDGQIKMRHIDEPVIPTLVYLKDCQNVSLKNFILRYPATKDDLYIIEGGSVTVEGCYTDTK